jgi:hypothetical protein
MGFGFDQSTRHPQSQARDSSGKRARMVFSNGMVAHLWAQQSQSFGRSNNGNFYFEGSTIYSYGSHFPIATFTDLRVGDKRVVLFTEDSYSPTTFGHCGDARHALHGRDDVVVIPVPSLPHVYLSAPSGKLPADVLDSIREVLIERIASAEEGFERARDQQWSTDYYTRELAEARDTYAAFARAFKYRRRLPADCRVYLAAKAERAQQARFKERVDGARRVAKHVPDYRAAPDSETWKIPAVGELSSGQAYEKIGALERYLSQLNTARHWLGRGHAGREVKARVARGRKVIAERLEQWRELHESTKAYEHKERLLSTAATIREHAAGTLPESEKWRMRDLLESPAWQLVRGASREIGHGMIDTLLAELAALGPEQVPGYSEVSAWLCRRASEALLLDSFPKPHAPSWSYERNRDKRSHEERVAAWLAGENVAGLYSDNPTLLRRRGKKLETSRGGSAPFSEAVVIYRAATTCRAAGRAWRRNGERMRVGHFELDAIDSHGNVRIGCHFIGYDEMARLAVREVPELVKPCFPLPVLRVEA